MIGRTSLDGVADDTLIALQTLVAEALEQRRLHNTFVANASSEVFHRQDCKYGSQIWEAHLVQLGSAQAGQEGGYNACRFCRPLD